MTVYFLLFAESLCANPKNASAFRPDVTQTGGDKCPICTDDDVIIRRIDDPKMAAGGYGPRDRVQVLPGKDGFNSGLSTFPRGLKQTIPNGNSGAYNVPTSQFLKHSTATLPTRTSNCSLNSLTTSSPDLTQQHQLQQQQQQQCGSSGSSNRGKVPPAVKIKDEAKMRLLSPDMRKYKKPNNSFGQSFPLKPLGPSSSVRDPREPLGWQNDPNASSHNIYT